MALYKVVTGGKNYVNTTLFKQALGIGPAGAAKAVAAGVKQLILLDDVLYEVEQTHERKYKALADSTEVQNLDKVLETFHLCSKDELFNLKAGDGQKRAVVVGISKPEEILEYGGWKLVRMRDVKYGSKYHLSERMALLQVCGSFYVALDARLKREAAPVVITIKA
jgi:hypothetical protein